MFASIDKYETFASYRLTHAIAVAEAFEAGRYPVQPADPAVIRHLPLAMVQEDPDNGFRSA
jgi:hypothetical protein